MTPEETTNYLWTGVWVFGTILGFALIIAALEWFDKDSKAPWKIRLVKWLDGRRK
jgi:hypothetical protein